MAEYQYRMVDRTTNSGKQLFKCDGCGDETPAPSKHHRCVSPSDDAKRIAADIIRTEAVCIEWGASPDRSVELAAQKIQPLFTALAIAAVALAESVKLQSHYAELLNMHDGGQRKTFATPAEWIARLKETGTIHA